MNICGKLRHVINQGHRGSLFTGVCVTSTGPCRGPVFVDTSRADVILQSMADTVWRSGVGRLSQQSRDRHLIDPRRVPQAEHNSQVAARREAEERSAAAITGTANARRSSRQRETDISEHGWNQIRKSKKARKWSVLLLDCASRAGCGPV